MPGRFISGVQRAAIKADLEAGMAVSLVAQKHHIAVSTAYRLDTERRTGAKPQRVDLLTDEQRECILADYREGVMSSDEIAKKYGTSRKKVIALASQAKCVRPHGRRVSESPNELIAGDWVYTDGIARWVPKQGVA